MSHKGFISLPLAGAAVAAAIIAVLGISLKVQSARLANAKEAHEQVKAEYAGFRLEVERIGKEAKAKADAERKRQEQVNKETVGNYEKRLAAVNDTYRRLRDQRASAGSSPVSALPAAPIATATTADSDRLLSVLEAADRQTQQLIELQAWVRAQAK